MNNKRVAILATDGYEKVELENPREKLKEAGATVDVVSIKEGEIKAWDEDHWEGSVPVDKQVSDAQVDDYDMLVLPGGVINPDQLRKDKEAVNFVKDFFERDKPVAAICHGAWTIAEADKARGRQMTSYTSIQTDLKNAGAEWRDESVVVDGNLITSRNPGDLENFNREIHKALNI